MNNNLMEGRGVMDAETHQPAPELKNNLQELVDLNVIVKESLSAFDKELSHLKAIVRYDVLPVIKGSSEKVRQLFLNIISSIVRYPPVLTKLIIYFSSQKDNAEIMDLTLEDGFLAHTISVFTNINAGEKWREKNEFLVDDCARILKSLGGSFASYTIVNTGCLYSFQVPAKNK